MRNAVPGAVALILTLGGCNHHTRAAPARARADAAQTAPAVDPKSPQVASAIVSRFYALLDARDYRAAFAMLQPGSIDGVTSPETLAAMAKGTAAFRREIGTPGNGEGACGSIYIAVPVRLVGRALADRHVTVTLRRVNDVDGATEAQRRWHVERIVEQPS